MKKTKKIDEIALQNSAQKTIKRVGWLLGLLAFFLYINTLGNSYNMDDTMVTNNHPLTSQGLSAISDIFTSPYYSDAEGYAYGYRPMVHLSFALQHDLFGEGPGAGHFINILLFALTCLLLFKFLIRLLGNERLLFAGIATLLFVVHPIHTEVVASLKNRDEILALLFALWAALLLLKYVELEKWISLIGVLILFSCAMLSKKSIFPLVIVLPIITLFLSNTSIKKSIFCSLTLFIPGILIGAELRTDRMIWMFLTLSVVLAFALFIKKVINKQEDYATLKSNWIIPSSICLVFCILSIYSNSALWLLFCLPFLWWILSLNIEKGIASLVLISILAYIGLGYTDFLITAFVVTIGVAIYKFRESKKINSWMLIALFLVVYKLFYDFDYGILFYVVNAMLFFLLLFYLAWIGLLFAIVTYATAIFVSGEYFFFYGIVLLIASLVWMVCCAPNGQRWLKLALLVVFMIPTSLKLSHEFQQENKQLKSQAENKKELTQLEFSKLHKDDVLKEGRALLYVENTLINAHSKQETIGTGFYVLGEYFKLHVFPKELSFYYGFSKIKTVGLKNVFVIISLLIHLVLIVLAVMNFRKRTLFSLGFLWYFSCILLFSNWAELVAGMLAERLAFTASIGFCLMLTAILFWIKPDFKLQRSGVIGIVFAVVVLLFAGRTIVRNANWKDAQTLMSHDINHLANSAQANNMYALTLMEKSMKDKSLNQLQIQNLQAQGLQHFQKAVSIYPQFFNAHIDIARAAYLTNQVDVGMKSVDKAISIHPKNTVPYMIGLRLSEKGGDFNAYLSVAKSLLKIEQTDKTYGYVAKAYYHLKQYDKSLEILNQGLEQFPSSEILNKNLKFIQNLLKKGLG